MELYVLIYNHKRQVCEEELLWLFDYHDAEILSLESES
jgi:hypothetical protein